MDEADKDGVALALRTAAAGAAGALTVANPEFGVLAVAALPALDAGIAQVRNRRREACGYTLAIAANEAALPVDELVHALTDNPTKALLLVRTLEAAADAALEAKLRVLGKGLASGALTDDDASVMEEVGWVAILREIEAPHLRILNHLLQQDAETPGHMIVASREKLKSISGFDQLLGPALSMLERNGLLRTAQSLGLDDYLRNRWGITDANSARHYVGGELTEACVGRFLRAAEPTPTHSAGE